MARRGQPIDPAELTLILDAGAVISLARGEAKTRARIAAARARGVEIIVPAVVLAETVRGNGPRDAPVNLVAASVPIVDVSEERARQAGALLGSADSSATIDALVVAEGLARAPAVVLTSDVGDLAVLAGSQPGIAIDAV